MILVALSLELTDILTENCKFSRNRFPVWYNLYVLLFLLTPCLVVAVQPYMEWIPIKKKISCSNISISISEKFIRKIYIIKLSCSSISVFVYIRKRSCSSIHSHGRPFWRPVYKFGHPMNEKKSKSVILLEIYFCACGAFQHSLLSVQKYFKTSILHIKNRSSSIS